MSYSVLKPPTIELRIEIIIFFVFIALLIKNFTFLGQIICLAFLF